MGEDHMIRQKNLGGHFGRLLGHALGVGVLTVASGALVAEAQEQAQTADQEQTLQTVIVTGSIIKRTDFETPSPVQVMTAEDLQQSGYTSVSDVLRNLSANGAGTLSQSFGLAFAGGGSGVALRGLTVGGTLTLVDSERMIPYPLSDDGQRNFVDITQIPFNVIDHIDVLKDGASAEYGSDAIAGVVNVVLKKTFTGASFTADAGTTSKSDGTTEHLAGIWGIGDLGSDGYNAYVSAEFRHQDPILLSNRSGFWTNQNWLPYGGYDTRYGSPNSSPASSTFPAILGGYVLDPNATATTPANTFGASTVFLHPTASCQNYASFEAGGCIYNPPLQVQPQTGNLDILSRLTKNLGGDWQAVVTGSLFRSEAEQVGQNNTPYAALNGLNTTTVQGVSAGVPPFSVTTPALLLPVGAPNNPFSAPATLFADFPQLGMSQTQFVTNTYRLFGDIRGSAAGWDIDGTLGWMYSELTGTNTGFIIPGALAATAASGFNFTTATPGQLAQAFAPTDGEKDTNTMEVVDLHGTRELAQLPGGALSVALGAGMYHLYKNSPAPTTVGEGLQLGNNAFVLGGQTDTNAYLEFVAPIIKGLEIDAAGRFDRYNTYGSSVTPKFGVKYSPFKLLTLRGTYGKGFRAPNAAESGEAAQGFSGGSYNDTVLCPNPTNPNAAGNFPTQCNRGLVALGVSNPDLQPEKSTNWTAGIILTPLDNTSISFDYWDIKVNQDIQSGFNVLALCESSPNNPVCQNLGNLFPIVRGPQVTLPFCTSTGNCTTQELTPVGPVLAEEFPYLNLTQTHVSGLDMDLASRFDIGSAGRLNASLNYSHTFHYIFGIAGDSVDLAGTHGPQIISGDTGNPKDRATASLAWDLGPWNVTASVNYVGTYNLTDPTSGFNTCQFAIESGGVLGPQLTRFPGTFPAAAAPLLQYCDVKSFTDVDLYARYAFNKNWEVHGSILNVFDTPPPVDLQTYGAAPSNAPYSPAMAQAGAVGRFFNVGATYTF
jgi:iron complex outermembrane receptor protein